MTERHRSGRRRVPADVIAIDRRRRHTAVATGTVLFRIDGLPVAAIEGDSSAIADARA